MKAMYTAFAVIALIGVVAGVTLTAFGPTTAEEYKAGGGAVRLLEDDPIDN